MRRGLGVRATLAAAIAAAFILALVVAPGAGAGTYGQPDRVLVATTGNDSELVSALEIQATRGIGRQVVMSLPATALGPLALGDRLLAGSELQVTTDCLARETRCIARPYRYDPTVEAQLVLAPEPSTTGGADTVPLSGVQRHRCVQRLPDREHHCMLAFLWPALNVTNPTPFCFPSSCYVNLVADAYNPAARPGDVLIVGEDEPDGTTKQDKGRVNAIRLRPNAPGPAPRGRVTTRVHRTPLTRRLEVGSASDRNQTVVSSQPLRHLRSGDQVAAWANLRTDVSQLPYNVLVRSKLIVTSRPDATKVTRLAKQVTDLNGELTEANGFNCTQAATPCRTLKAGVGSMITDARDRSGAPVPLYVNLVTETMAKRASAKPGDAAQILNGRLRVTLYPASRRG